VSSILDRAYDAAVGRCLQAMLDLRRIDGTAAISELKTAIRIIEDGRRKADREHHVEAFRNRVAAPAVPPDLSLDF
jgi:hypothetical protein